jgi:hypothetical protein
MKMYVINLIHTAEKLCFLKNHVYKVCHQNIIIIIRLLSAILTRLLAQQ